MDSASGRFLSVNSRFAEILGYAPDELLDSTFHHITHPDHLLEDMGSVQELVSGAVLEVQKEKRYLHRSGKVLWGRLRMVRMPSTPGESPQHISLVEDISEVHQVQELLRNSEERFRTLIADLQVGVLIQSADSEILLSNPKALELLGLSEDQLIGKTSFSPEWNVIHEDGTPYPGPTHPVPQAIATLQPVRNAVMGVYRPVSQDRVWLLVNADPQLYLDQSLHQVICTFVDITARKELLAQLREIEAQNKAIISAIPDLIFSFNREGEYLNISASNPSLLIRPREFLLGTKLTDSLPGPIAEQCLNAIGKALDLKEVQELEYALPIAGKERTFEARLAPSTNDEVVAIVRDITEHKQTAEHQRFLEAQLQQSQKLESLGVLVAGVAHTMNNVLAVIMGVASLNEKSGTAPQDLEAYKIINTACMRGREVVKSLIRFGKPTISMLAPVELLGLVGEVCSLLENTTLSRIKILAVGDGAPLWMLGDAGSINLGLMNLCFNALEAMPDGGTLTLRVSSVGGDSAEVAVEDCGTGMTPEIQVRALEPFFTTKDASSGAGLGLSMTYGVVKAHGGTIDITSQPGLGTTVKLRFPRIPAPVHVKAVTPLAPPLNLRKITLVDDEGDVRFLMTRMLKKAGVGEVETAASGEEALEKLLSGELPDVLILDQNMPGMTGLQLMAKVRDKYPYLPILFSSGQPDIESWEILKQPRVAVISKPFTMEEINVKLAQFASEHNQGQ